MFHFNKDHPSSAGFTIQMEAANLFFSPLKYKAKQDLSHNHQIFINAFLVLLLNINKN